MKLCSNVEIKKKKRKKKVNLQKVFRERKRERIYIIGKMSKKKILFIFDPIYIYLFT